MWLYAIGNFHDIDVSQLRKVRLKFKFKPTTFPLKIAFQDQVICCFLFVFYVATLFFVWSRNHRMLYLPCTHVLEGDSSNQPLVLIVGNPRIASTLPEDVWLGRSQVDSCTVPWIGWKWSVWRERSKWIDIDCWKQKRIQVKILMNWVANDFHAMLTPSDEKLPFNYQGRAAWLWLLWSLAPDYWQLVVSARPCCCARRLAFSMLIMVSKILGMALLYDFVGSRSLDNFRAVPFSWKKGWPRIQGLKKNKDDV